MIGATCCYIPDQGPPLGEACGAPAEYEIWTPPDPYATTHACAAHLEPMLADGVQVVYPVGVAPCEVLGHGIPPGGPTDRVVDLGHGA